MLSDWQKICAKIPLKLKGLDIILIHPNKPSDGFTVNSTGYEPYPPQYQEKKNFRKRTL